MSRGRHLAPDFRRPELTTGWEKITKNLGVRITAAVVLLGGTGSLVIAAVGK